MHAAVAVAAVVEIDAVFAADVLASAAGVGFADAAVVAAADAVGFADEDTTVERISQSVER